MMGEVSQMSQGDSVFSWLHVGGSILLHCAWLTLRHLQGFSSDVPSSRKPS